MTYVIAVDDDPEVLDTLGRVLEREAYDVSLASSASEALALLEERAPDLAILDIIMPGMDGISL
ncbi:MAG: response regulator, partial [Anaerolineae bacterium]|nr:response regulator [Anaerolineae bacterium]